MLTTLLPRVQQFLKRIIKVVIVAFLLVILTTYGWGIDSFVLDKTIEEGLSQRLERTVRILSEDIGIRNYVAYKNLEKAADYIKQDFSESGYEVEEWAYQIEGKTYKNIVVKTKESINNEYIIVGAHYDSCFNPGADDNASGIAGVLELAKALKNEHLKTPIMFVAFTNEEPPFFMTSNMGSFVLARKLKHDGVKIKAAIVLEMIGKYSDKKFSQRYPPLLGLFYPNKGNFIALVGNFSSKSIVNFISRDFKHHKHYPLKANISPEFIPGVSFSDHWSFWQQGYPAVMVTDTAYLRNKNYHKKTDKVDTLDYQKMSLVVEGLKESIKNLANQ